MTNSDSHLYNILLEIKDQIGDLKSATSELKSDMKSTLLQTTKTNGRVNHLEDEMDKRKEFENTWKGKISIIGVLLGLIGTIVGDFIRRTLG